MAKKQLAWKVGQDATINRLNDTAPDLEKHLEDWIEADPDIVDRDLLLIARQCPTDFGTYIDLLGLTSQGDLVIIELKRDRTPRETVAQALEYAAWASRLSYSRIINVSLPMHQSEDKLLAAFAERFDSSLPDTLNQDQKIILVAPQITDSVRVVIEYLAETYNVPVNGVSLSLFQAGEEKVLVRDLVIQDDEIVARSGSKRRPSPTMEEFTKLAAENGVGEVNDYLWSLNHHFPAPMRYINGWGFRMKAQDGKFITLFTVFCTANSYPGKVGIAMGADNLIKLFGRTESDAQHFLEKLSSQVGRPVNGIWQGWTRFTIDSLDQIEQFISELNNFTGLNLEPK
jgi:endonuclease NucS-like protein